MAELDPERTARPYRRSATLGVAVLTGLTLFSAGGRYAFDQLRSGTDYRVADEAWQVYDQTGKVPVTDGVSRQKIDVSCTTSLLGNKVLYALLYIDEDYRGTAIPFEPCEDDRIAENEWTATAEALNQKVLPRILS